MTVRARVKCAHTRKTYLRIALWACKDRPWLRGDPQGGGPWTCAHPLANGTLINHSPGDWHGFGQCSDGPPLYLR